MGNRSRNEARIEFELTRCNCCKKERKDIDDFIYPSNCHIRNKFWAFNFDDMAFPKEIKEGLDNEDNIEYNCAAFSKR